MRYLLPILFCLLCLIWTYPVHGQCASTPLAVDDHVVAKTESVLIDVLANDSNDDGAALEVTLSGNTCGVPASADNNLVYLNITTTQRLSSDCSVFYYLETEGGQVSGPAKIHVDFVEGIFSDGFEGGNTTEWSTSS